MLLVSAAIPFYAEPYDQFVVLGNERIDSAIVLGVAGLVEGGSYDDAQLNAALQRLYASGRFEDVTMTTQGSRVTITVVENATIGNISFEGNRAITDAQLAEIVRLETRDGLDRARVEEEAQNIRRAYASRSRLDAEIRPVVIPSTPGVFDVVFEISEGETAEVQRISFTGNRAVGDERLLRAISSGERNLFSRIYSRDNFASERMVSDEERLRDYYRENGYFHAEITAASADYDAAGDYYLTYAIKEGRQYRFGKITVASEIPGVNSDDYLGFVESEAGELYQASRVRQTISRIEEQAGEDGLPFLQVIAEPVAVEASGVVDIRYRLSNAERSYLERIDIHGNETTVDRVIRRQFALVEGDPYNERKVQEAKRRIERLGFFGQTRVRTREGSAEGMKIVDVEVEEQSTGNMVFGINYSTEPGWGLNGRLTERNFLGRGQYLSLDLLTGRDTNLRLGFAEPGLFERDLTAGFDLYYSDTNRAASVFETTDYGFEPYIRMRASEHSRLSLGYFLRSNEIRDVTDATSPLIKAEEGSILTSGLSANWVWDRLNLAQSPTDGSIFRLGGKLAGLGGDASWFQLGGKFKTYHSIWDDNLIFSAEVEGGHINSLNEENVRVTDRYFLGGDSLLGFAGGGIGPRDKTDDINSALGGNNYMALRTELTFPLGLPEELQVRGGVFMNAGSVWGLDQVEGGASGTVDDGFKLRGAAGVQVLWNILGQDLRFSWSEPYMAEENDRTRNFSISLSTRF